MDECFIKTFNHPANDMVMWVSFYLLTKSFPPKISTRNSSFTIRFIIVFVMHIKHLDKFGESRILKAFSNFFSVKGSPPIINIHCHPFHGKASFFFFTCLDCKTYLHALSRISAGKISMFFSRTLSLKTSLFLSSHKDFNAFKLP